jgi:hypothetical protein
LEELFKTKKEEFGNLKYQSKHKDTKIEILTKALEIANEKLVIMNSALIIF